MSELDRFLKSRGFILHSQDSAHLNYKHKDLVYILTIDAHSMKDQVKTIYIRKILSALDELTT
ncbi:MAG: type II toxin-antitoxin system HicA family toxin [Erysipelotrichaceae bacterium]